MDTFSKIGIEVATGETEYEGTVLTRRIVSVNTPVLAAATNDRPAELTARFVDFVDIDEAMELSAPASVRPIVREMKHRHHEIARLMTLGLSHIQIAERVGCSPTTVGLLKRSPAFQVLLSQQRQSRENALRDLTREISFVGNLTLAELEMRIPDMSNKDLIKLSTNFLDRTGHAPVNKNLNITANAADVSDIKRRAQEANDGRVERVIDAEFEEVSTPADTESREAELGDADGAELIALPFGKRDEE